MKQPVLWLLCLVTSIVIAQDNNQSQLTIDQIMQGEDFVGYLPTNIEWSENNKDIYFSWNPDKDTIRSTYKVDFASKKIEKLSFEALKTKMSPNHTSKDGTWSVYQKQGDLFLKNNKTNTLKQITNTSVYEANPKFSGDQESIIYRQKNNLYQWHINKGTTKQLTNFKTGTKSEDSKLSEQDQWLEDDQLAYFNILEKRKNEKQAQKYRSEQTKLERPETVYLEKRKLSSLTISPNLKYVFYRLYTSVKGKTIVPDYVTQSGYTKDLNARRKVGGKQNNYQSWILNLETGKTYQIKTEALPGIKDKPEFLKDYAENVSKYQDKYEAPRDVLIGTPMFSEEGKVLVNITSSDNKDRWIAIVNPQDGSLKTIDKQHDDAWIGGPGVGWFSQAKMGWLSNETIWFMSEKTGFTHLYTANINTNKIKELTSGEFEIQSVTLSKNKKTFYITSNKKSPHEKHFYHLPAKGGKMTQITSKKGGHEVTISPDETQLAIRYSYTNKPWELFVMPNRGGADMVQLTTSTTKEFDAHQWMDPEIIQFAAKDGAQVPATLYKPAPEKSNGAAVIFVHGAGYLQNVHYWWPSYFREFMFHNFLTDNGYTVLAIDFRASAGYGRDWRTGIYRHMGGKDLDDQVDGAKYLVETQNIDADKIGIYGGSYGGFITLMAMFNYPDTFKSGAALRSVTDWAHYNHGYTSNILNTPIEDPIAYKKSSPIYFAEGLKGNLLILHGMIDTNVHFQDVVRLSQRLIELKKENWELAVFPLEGHGFKESSSWSDEYRRIYKLFETTLKD